jgi:hypothetical protein
MADIRVTGMVDDFERANENPAQPPWVRDYAGHVDCKIVSGNFVGTDFPPTGSQMYHQTQSFTGDTIEIWARASGNAAASDGWRIGLCTSGDPSGWLCIPWDPPSANPQWLLRKYTAGSFSTVVTQTNALPGNLEYVMVRLTASDVECWLGSTDAQTWTQIISYSDSAYRSNLYMHLGLTGIETEWSEMGGGLNNWMPEFIRRPWEHHGRHLTL